MSQDKVDLLKGKLEQANLLNQAESLFKNPSATIADIMSDFDTSKTVEEQPNSNLYKFGKFIQMIKPTYDINNLILLKKTQISTFVKSALESYLRNEGIDDSDDAAASAKQAVYGILFGKQAKGSLDRLNMGVKHKRGFDAFGVLRVNTHEENVKHGLQSRISINDLIDLDNKPGVLYSELKNILGENFNDILIKAVINEIRARGQTHTTLYQILKHDTLLGQKTADVLLDFRDADLTATLNGVGKIRESKDILENIGSFCGELAKSSHPKVKEILEHGVTKGIGSYLKHTLFAILLNTVGNQKIDEKTGEAKLGLGLDNWRDRGEWLKRAGIIGGGIAAVKTGALGVAFGAASTPVGMAVVAGGLSASVLYSHLRENHLNKIKESFDRFMTYKPNFEIFAKKVADGDSTLSGKIEMLRTKIPEKGNKAFFQVKLLKSSLDDKTKKTPIKEVLIKPGKEGKINFQSLIQDINDAMNGKENGTKEVKVGNKVIYKVKYDEESSRVIVE